MRTLLPAILLCLASSALADVPPPPGYVEQCTVEKQCQKNEDGDACSAWHGDHDKCKKLHQSDGFVYKCSTRGASVWTEVYCRPKGSKNPK
jgi:3-methyladenine DNA glycosylase Mpg